MRMHLRHIAAAGALVTLAGVALASVNQAPDATDVSAKLHPQLIARLNNEPGPAKGWVFFTDKGNMSPAQQHAAIAQLAEDYGERAKRRRAARGSVDRRAHGLFDVRDLPVAQGYVDAVAATGARVHVSSRWLNAVSVIATSAQYDEIARLAFVSRLQPVARSAIVRPVRIGPEFEVTTTGGGGEERSRVDYGNSQSQLDQINLIGLHNEGFTGAGVVVGILDTGFRRDHQAFNYAGHELNVIAEYDFVDDDGNAGIDAGDPSDQHNHGTMILGCLGAYYPGSLVGGAFDASFVLCKTEDTTGEYPAEEDNYVAGLEFTELNGADIVTSSLGYIDWYSQADLDGMTAVTTIAVNIATANGMHCCNAAGNEYHDSNPATSSLIAPADAFQVITCGAVGSTGDIASFSSDGPTADGRVKPEVLARGLSTHTVSPYSTTGYTTADGTSLSTPLVACAVACLTQARPYWSVDQMRENLFETADYYQQYETYDPLFVRGYGVIDALTAYQNCPEAGVVTLDSVAYACESTITVTVNDCGLNTDDGLVEYVVVDVDSDTESGVETLTLVETDASSAEFIGAIPADTTNAVGVLWISPGDTITATYIDADDGAGGFGITVMSTAIVDCIAPAISNVHMVDVQARSATVGFDTDEPTRATVYYGQSCAVLDQVAASAAYVTATELLLGGLDDNTSYYYTVEATDAAGNSTTDDNAGACYTFVTPETPDFYTEEYSGSDNDLDFLSLRFRPGAPVDFYTACVEPITALPTDPTGGTVVSLPDDGYQYIGLFGAQVWLYGVGYGGLYVGSNGYVTFTEGDSDHTEGIADHFDTPRISGLFHDLAPHEGGTVRCQQLVDRVVVTYENVPEYGTTNANTFQIEMYDDGTITISYLGVAVSEGIAGLSDGQGTPDGFVEFDLSAAGGCNALGDLNCDGLVNNGDIDAFVLAITDADGYSSSYPDCDRALADCDQDGLVNNGDIDAFVDLLAGE